MAVETAVYISDLNEAYPAGGEPVAQGDDHIRLIKAVLKASFPGMIGVHKAFPSGTRMPFAQATAPTGWTQDTTDAADNRMLRVVKTGGGGTAGSHSPILNNVVPSHTHNFTTLNENVGHSHSGNTGGQSNDHNHGYSQPSFDFVTDFAVGVSVSRATTGATTGGASADHSHSFTTGDRSTPHNHSGTTDNGSSSTNWTPRYIDLIICAKD